jgi:hypothetical protein
VITAYAYENRVYVKYRKKLGPIEIGPATKTNCRVSLSSGKPDPCILVVIVTFFDWFVKNGTYIKILNFFSSGFLYMCRGEDLNLHRIAPVSS